MEGGYYHRQRAWDMQVYCIVLDKGVKMCDKCKDADKKSEGITILGDRYCSWECFRKRKNEMIKELVNK